jgi:NitT/TauT family transport system substrate-binding protein
VSTALAATSLTFLACGVAAPVAPASVPTVRLAVNRSAPLSSAAWIANDTGLFTQHGLNAELQAIDPSAGVRALIANEVDGAVLPSTQAIAAAGAGSQLQIVATLNVSALVLTAPIDVISIDQLRGKVIGVTSRASSNAAGTVRLLRIQGMEPDSDYQLLATGESGGYAAMVAALSTHQLDAAALDRDFARKLVSSGNFHNVVDFKEAGISDAGLTLVFSSSYAGGHADVVQKVVDTLVDTVHYAHDHKAETQQVFSKYYGLSDRSELDATYATEMALWLKEPASVADQFADILDAIGPENPAVKSIDLGKLIAPTYVADARRRGLTDY